MVGFVSILTLWHKLEKIDQSLFMLINSRFTNPVFDAICPYIRDSVFWSPLYLFIGAFITINYGKKGWLWSLAFVSTVAIADMIGARVFKEGFERLRPCQDPLFSEKVRLLLKHCAGSYSFVSNHAANHFGIATFVSRTFYPVFGNKIYLIYLWAVFISYAQIYVGVHYPLDIIGGGLLGIAAGLFTSYIFITKAGSFTRL